MLKALPIGLSDFKRIIDDSYYYVDKTLFIDEILKYSSGVTLLARPRRFGKTVNMSMLKYFFEKTATPHAYLFEDKNIWQLPERRALQGIFPVIFLTFKDIKQSTWEVTRDKIIATIAAEYERHRYLLGADTMSVEQKEVYLKIVSKKANEGEYHDSLKNLSEFLYHYHKVKPFVLCDEYDSPIHAGFSHGYYLEVSEFMRGLMAGVFKDNMYLELGVITGILRTAKEGIFSGLNNLKVFTILDDPMADKFGFTQQETFKLLDDYHLTDLRDDFKSWYNGYLMGKTTMYNPWSVLNCIDRGGAFITYWANTSDNALIYKIIAQAEPRFKDACADLIAGNVVSSIKIEDKMALPGMLYAGDALWNLLLFSGYVTPSCHGNNEGGYYADLTLPNKELRVLFKKLVEDLFKESLGYAEIEALRNVLHKADGQLFEDMLARFISHSMSIHDIDSNEPEKSYHLFILGLCVTLSDRYLVISNRESGLGRYDIMLIPKDKSDPGLIIEFKKKGKSETMHECADRALEQIKEKNYVSQLQQHGIIHAVAFGIAVYKKEVFLKQENV